MPDKVNGNNYSGKSKIVSLNSSHTPIQPKSELQLNERDQKLATLQKMADNNPYSQRFAHFTSMANNSIPQQPVSQLSKDNNGLPDNLKQGVESLSGISMDDVKVHYNSDKPAQLNAHAYAQGTDIHIASGQEKHLPHEAWHVVQQKQGRVQPTTMMKAKVFINDDKGLEKEADVMGARALQMKPFSLSDYKTEKSVQRKEIIQRAPGFGEVLVSAGRAVAGKALDSAGEGFEFLTDHVIPITVNIKGLKDAADQGKEIQDKSNLGFDEIGITFAKMTKPMADLTAITAKYAGNEVASKFLPGVSDGLAAFESAIKAYQTNKKRQLVIALTKSGANLTPNEEETLTLYLYELTKEFRSQIFDGVISAISCIGTYLPDGGITKAAALSFGALKQGLVFYFKYRELQELKRSKRIGDTDVKTLKDERILEKSKNPSFPKAILILQEIKKLEGVEPKNQTQIDENEKQLNIMLIKMNSSFLHLAKDDKTRITRDNLELFLQTQFMVINQIAAEVKKKDEEKAFFRMYDDKDVIINLMNKDPKFSALYEISLNEIGKLDPEHESYFYKKTQDAIFAAIDRKYITASERLTAFKEMLVNKWEDYNIYHLLKNHYEESGKTELAVDMPVQERHIIYLDQFIKDVKL